jgi:hypothetical protein
MGIRFCDSMMDRCRISPRSSDGIDTSFERCWRHPVRWSRGRSYVAGVTMLLLLPSFLLMSEKIQIMMSHHPPPTAVLVVY